MSSELPLLQLATVIAVIVVIAGWLAAAALTVVFVQRRVARLLAGVPPAERAARGSDFALLLYGLSRSFWPAAFLVGAMLLRDPRRVRPGRVCIVLGLVEITGVVLLTCAGMLLLVFFAPGTLGPWLSPGTSAGVVAGEDDPGAPAFAAPAAEVPQAAGADAGAAGGTAMDGQQRRVGEVFSLELQSQRNPPSPEFGHAWGDAQVAGDALVFLEKRVLSPPADEDGGYFRHVYRFQAVRPGQATITIPDPPQGAYQVLVTVVPG